MKSLSCQTILITGGCGFIGTNFIRYLFTQNDFTGKIINLDALTYAGNPNNLLDIEKTFSDRYQFIHGDICNYTLIQELFAKYSIDGIVHFAAESHVDRSIVGPRAFIETNILGTFNLLEVARAHWKDRKDVFFHHISTDEVFGSLGQKGYFYETTPYDPRSPYSASKASSDHLVSAYFHTYQLPVTISNCSNNYGPYQFPEKLIPLMICNMLVGKELPIYGDGLNSRDWLYVTDHCSGIWSIIKNGRVGETYNIGGENEWTNKKLLIKLCEIMNEIRPVSGSYKELITYVKDRPGHDRRYAINCDKIKQELGWSQSCNFEIGLHLTVEWYLNNQKWVQQISSGEYQHWLEVNYSKR